jgi:hypothetical protein
LSPYWPIPLCWGSPLGKVSSFFAKN